MSNGAVALPAKPGSVEMAAHSSFALALNWAVIALGLGILAMGDAWLWPVGIVLLAANQHRNALLGHEAAHFLLYRSRRLNDLVGNLLCLYPLGTTVAAYRRWHFQHHRHLGTAEDPEHEVKFGWKYALPYTRRKMIGLFLGDLVGAGAPEVLRLQWVLRPRGPDRWGLLLYWCVLLGLVAAFSLWWLLAAWVFSLLTVFWAFYRIRAYSEHVGIPGTHRFQAPWWMRYAVFPHNTWLHHEHHRHPGIPCWQLPRVPDAGHPQSLLQALSIQPAGRTDPSVPAGGSVSPRISA